MDEKLDALRRRVEAEPQDHEARLALVQGLTRQGRAAEAFAALKTLRRRPDVPAELTASRYRLAKQRAGARPLTRPSGNEGGAAVLPPGFAALRARFDEPGLSLGPDTLPEDTRFEVSAQAVDEEGQRLAWVDEDWDERNSGMVHASIKLHLAEKQRRVFDWELPSYNQYFGCDAAHLSFFDEQILVAYREKHAFLVLLVDREKEARGLALDGRPVFAFDDLLLCRSACSGLLDAFSLPGFHPLRPLPLTAAADRAPFDLELELADDALLLGDGGSLPLVSTGELALEENADRILAELSPFIPKILEADGVTALLASQLHAFWLRQSDDQYLGFSSFRRGLSLENLPVYAAREALDKGRKEEADALVQQLRAIAEAEAQPASALARDAWRHLRNRARVLIEDCERGRLAPGRWDHSFLFGGVRRLRPWLPEAAAREVDRLAAVEGLRIDGDRG